MTKQLRDNLKEQAANFNWAIIDLFDLPDDVSFQIKKLSPKTLTCDIKDENLISFLIDNNLINEKETRTKYKKIGVVLFAAKIKQRDSRFYYAFELCSAIREALD